MANGSIKVENMQKSIFVGHNVSGSVTNTVTEGQSESTIDFSQLAHELSKLRETMMQKATDVEKVIAVGEVAKAEQSAKAQDGSKVMEHLKASGQWALNIATAIGIPIAVEVIRKALSLK